MVGKQQPQSSSACLYKAHKVTYGQHYRIASGLNSSQRWKAEKHFLHENYSIVANFVSLPNDRNKTKKLKCKRMEKNWHCSIYPQGQNCYSH